MVTASHGTLSLDQTSAYPLAEGGAPLSLPGSGARGRIGIVFIHGFTGRPSSVAPVVKALNARGFSVEAPRLPGHGTDVKDMLGTRYTDWREHVRRVTLALSEHVDAIVVAGLSMGGTLAIDIGTLCLPKVVGIVPINAQILDRKGLAVRFAPFIGKVMPLAPAALAGLKRNDVKKPCVDEHAYKSTPVLAGHSLVEALPQVREHLPAIRVPVLVVRSREDHSVNPANSIALLQSLPNAIVSELVLENSYHVATLDYDAELLIDRITEFADQAGNVHVARV